MAAELVSLADRLNWLIEQSGMSAGALSEHCGLTRQQLNTTLDRLRANPSANIEMKTAIKLQEGTGISMDWLASGIGPRFVAQKVAYDGARYPNLQEALETMRARILDETYERMASLAMNFPTDRSVGEWVDEIRSLDSSIRRSKKTGDSVGLGRPIDDDDDAPPAGIE